MGTFVPQHCLNISTSMEPILQSCSRNGSLWMGSQPTAHAHTSLWDRGRKPPVLGHLELYNTVKGTVLLHLHIHTIFKEMLM